MELVDAMMGFVHSNVPIVFEGLDFVLQPKPMEMNKTNICEAFASKTHRHPHLSLGAIVPFVHIFVDVLHGIEGPTNFYIHVAIVFVNQDDVVRHNPPIINPYGFSHSIDGDSLLLEETIIIPEFKKKKKKHLLGGTYFRMPSLRGRDITSDTTGMSFRR